MNRKVFYGYGFDRREMRIFSKLSEDGQAAALDLLKRGIEDHELITYDELNDFRLMNVEAVGVPNAASARVSVQMAIERFGGRCGWGDNQS